ncbi:uncharacterized protein [Solanum lycopersicum]|uniref:uncharacterized protein n=1 Tax=Solanum lycopersicum TaxID=4081 RepID=UPI000532A9F9|nr:uncharacterized protein LOC104647306 [Solanum lycopersicum]
MTCSACKSKGHNIRTCPNKPPATSEGIATSQTSKCSKRSDKQKSHPPQAMQQSQSSEPFQAIVQSGSGNIKGANDAFKRPRVVGYGVFVSKDGFICAEQGRSISRVIKSGAQEKLISSAVVTGDLGYAPSKGLKWKGKSAITGSQLQYKSALLRQKNIKSQTSSQGQHELKVFRDDVADFSCGSNYF